MPVAATSWHASAVSYSRVVLTIKAPARIRTASVAYRVSLTNGLQAALKTSVAGPLCNLRLAARGERGASAASVTSHTCFFSGVSAVDYLLTIKAPLRVSRSAVVSFSIILLPNVPRAALSTSLAGTVAKLRLAAQGEMGRESKRGKGHSPTGLFGAISLVAKAAACRRRARGCLCEGMPECLLSRI
ncbi:hypothetical protein MTO96_021100 [Rhipicephalus appendiculatus]